MIPIFPFGVAIWILALNFHRRDSPAEWNLTYYQGPGQPTTREVFSAYRCDLAMRDGHLIAVANNEGEFWVNLRHQDDRLVATVSGNMGYFLPEHANVPFSFRHPGSEELWVEATLPRKGPPRPIRLGIKKDGVLTPLAID
jgi:hypothetical protein